METNIQIPLSLEVVEISTRLRLDSARAKGAGLAGLVSLAQNLMMSRSVYGVGYVGEKKAGTVEVELPGDRRVAFESRILRSNLEKAQKVFPYVITIGPELEREAVAHGDLLRQYCLEEIANMALEKAADWLAAHLEKRFGVSGLSNMSPGSLDDWPITEQAKLFGLLGDTEKAIGVRLTENFLMIPRKSISGILFPSEEGFQACRLCPRERCLSRKAPYDESETARISQE